MDLVIKNFLSRNLSDFADCFNIDIAENESENFVITAKDGSVNITASNYIMAFH